MKKDIQIIKRSYLFKSSSDKEINDIIKKLNPIIKTYQKDEFLLRTSEITRNFGIILDGQLQVIKEDYFTGKKIILTELSQSDIFAEVYSYLEDVPLEVSVIASKVSKIIFMDMQDLIEICNKNDSYKVIIDNLLKTLALKNLMLTQKIEHISKRQIKERLLSYLTTQSIIHCSNKFEIPFDRQQLADYLCVDRSALSKEIGNLNRAGIIKATKNKFEILKVTEE